jgi:tripartite-type tricarboxylate transporter receptor subunit TctC
VLNKEVNAALGDATIQKRLTDIGAIPLQPSSPAEFAKFIADDVAKWAKVIKASGMKPE